MDQPGLDPRLHEDALRALRRVNRISGTAAHLWPPIRRLAAELSRPPRVLDLASGGGDVAVELACRAAREDMAIQIDGCDISPVAAEYANAQAGQRGLTNVRFMVHDALRQPLPAGYDVVTCSLFLHHLDENDAVLLLRHMADAARHLVLVDDLRRSRIGLAMAWIGCHVLSRSPVVHVDGPRSVKAAFTRAEMAVLAQRAGLIGFTLTPHWPQRFLLSWNKA